MKMDGFFRIAFTGSAGSGFGLLVLHNGNIAGADIGGATYDGKYTVDLKTNNAVFDVTMTAPAGVTPVQTGIPLAAPATIPITGTLRQEDMESNKPTLVHSALGPVNVLFTKIRDFS
jgi:hypothetical protein